MEQIKGIWLSALAILQTRRISWQSSSGFTNLEPKKIGGIVSNGMLLAADGPEGRPIFLTVAEEDDVVIGAVIK